MAVFIGILLLVLYFIPSFVAEHNKKANSTAIFVLNLFLGWTFIGWIIALIWATTKEAHPATVAVVQQAAAEPRSAIRPAIKEGMVPEFVEYAKNHKPLMLLIGLMVFCGVLLVIAQPYLGN
jgi:pheromone shutdown protein TraB